MFEDYDPYLTSFIRDVGTGISLVFKAFELFLGISYFVGSKIVESVVWMIASSGKGYNEISTVAAIFRDEITEFGYSFGRALFLIYYAGIKVVDSFFIVADDLMNLYFHVKESLSRTIIQSSDAIVGGIGGIGGVFTVVPNQIVEALCMVGDASVAFGECVIAVIMDFLKQLVLAPINVLILIGKTLGNVASLPVQFVHRMPPSSFLGLIVIIIILFLTRRLLRYIVLRNIQLFFSCIVRGLCHALSFIRLTRFKNLISSSVSTIVSANDQGNTNNHSKPTCVICQENPVTFMSNPCKHVCLCDQCVYQYLEHDNRCPMCRSRVTKYDRVFIP